MTPKILKAGLVVGALVFALVSCGQNTKPMADLPKTVSLDSGDEWKGKITTVIKDKDSDSLTLSNFSSTDAAVATIGVDKASNPTEIIITAGTLVPAPPATRQQRATVSFQVSDGTETITVSVKVTVTAPLLDCMIMIPGGTAIVPIACTLGSYHKPHVLPSRASTEAIDPILFKLSDHPKFSTYREYDSANPPNFTAPVLLGGEHYLDGTVPRLGDCDDTEDYDGDNNDSNDNDCIVITLPAAAASRIPTPASVTVVLELTAEHKTGTADDVTEIIHFKVKPYTTS